MNRIIASLLSMYFILCSSCTRNNNEILIVCASSFQPALDSLIQNYTSQALEYNYKIIPGATGKLTTQILQGAPFDYFISLDEKCNDQLLSNGFSSREYTKFCSSGLIIWNKESRKNINDWSADDKIAIANPKFAPYGELSLQYLSKNGLFNDMKNSLVYTDDISLVNQFIYSENVDYAFTSTSAIIGLDLSSDKYSIIPNETLDVYALNLSYLLISIFNVINSIFNNIQTSSNNNTLLVSHMSTTLLLVI